MTFIKYPHLERFGTPEVHGIELGQMYVFPKIDGTNASVWATDGLIRAGSRTRELSIDQDNAGFYGFASQNPRIIEYLNTNPTHRLYGEWLVPHSLKTYREDAWRRFYVFDVADDSGLLHYEHYINQVEFHGLDYIPPIAIIQNTNYEQLIGQLAKNTFLIEDGKGAGEGIVVKNYEYRNKYGRQTWAKIVTSEFKEQHRKEMGTPKLQGQKLIEEEIAKKYVTKALCEKVLAKIDNEGGFTSRRIPELLNVVYYDVVREDCWNFVKEHKNPNINFKTLQQLIYSEVKQNLPQVF